jgi:hypothetical protein
LGFRARRAGLGRGGRRRQVSESGKLETDDFVAVDEEEEEAKGFDD